jgi:Bacterial Ig domain
LEDLIRGEKLMKRSILLASLAAALVLGLLLPHAQAQMGPVQFNKSVTVDSGVAATVGHAMSSHVMGDPTKLVPYSIRPATKPKSGTVTIGRVGDRTTISYRSKPGFVGQDSFQYVRVSNDKFAGTYTVAVTVK